MTQSVDLEYQTLPALAPLYARAATRLSDHWSDDEAVPTVIARTAALAPRSGHLARYREVCAFPRGATLPITYPHVWAFPLQMAVLTHRQFPLKLLGLVHVRNEIAQHRAVDNDERLGLQVRAQDYRQVGRGIEFDLVTELSASSGDIVWEETATMLSRRRTGKRSGHDKRKNELPPSAYDETAGWDVAVNIGRRYAFVAGDCNPIHLSTLSARLFGFRRAIATGMWLKARVAAELTPRMTSSALELGVSFRKPVFLPGAVTLNYCLNAQGADFSLNDSREEIVHLQGQVRYFQVESPAV